MPLTTVPLPYGLRDVKLFTFTGEVPATVGVDLPNARTLSFSEAEDFEELRGDDGVVAVRGQGATVEWELEGGGISFEAVKAMYGGTISETGTTPAIVKTYSKKGTDARPYFKASGLAISDSGGSFTVVLWKCRATGELSGELADGAFWLTGASGRAIAINTAIVGPPAAAVGDVYAMIQNETAAATAL